MNPSASALVQQPSATGGPRPAAPALPGLAIVVLALALGACSKAPVESSAPMATPPQAGSAPATAVGSNTSVPDAASVLKPGDAAKADPATGRSNGAMTRAQESGAMPLPGQNNDHSAPLPPARRASGT